MWYETILAVKCCYLLLTVSWNLSVVVHLYISLFILGYAFCRLCGSQVEWFPWRLTSHFIVVQGLESVNSSTSNIDSSTWLVLLIDKTTCGIQGVLSDGSCDSVNLTLSMITLVITRAVVAFIVITILNVLHEFIRKLKKPLNQKWPGVSWLLRIYFQTFYSVIWIYHNFCFVLTVKQAQTRCNLISNLTYIHKEWQIS